MGGLLTLLLRNKTIALALVAAIALSIWGTTCQCRRILNPPEPRPPKIFKITVSAVPTGASIEMKLGPLGRRNTVIMLDGISAPISGSLAEQSRANLERMAGKLCRVETERHGLFKSAEFDENKEAIAPEEPPLLEADAAAEIYGLKPIVGVVFGESGLCLNTEQLAAGMAKLLPDGPKEWKTFEAKAQKQKLGVWK